MASQALTLTPGLGSTSRCGDHAVVDDGGVALRTRPQAGDREVGGQAHRLGELGVAVGEHHDLVPDALGVGPGLHHPGVVDGDAGDGGDALGAQRVGVCT